MQKCIVHFIRPIFFIRFSHLTLTFLISGKLLSENKRKTIDLNCMHKNGVVGSGPDDVAADQIGFTILSATAATDKKVRWDALRLHADTVDEGRRSSKTDVVEAEATWWKCSRNDYHDTGLTGRR